MIHPCADKRLAKHRTNSQEVAEFQGRLCLNRVGALGHDVVVVEMIDIPHEPLVARVTTQKNEPGAQRNIIERLTVGQTRSNGVPQAHGQDASQSGAPRGSHPNLPS